MNTETKVGKSMAVQQWLVLLMTQTHCGDGGLIFFDQLRSGEEPRLTRIRKGCTLVHYACEHGWLDFMKFIIQEHDCSPHARTFAGLTPLHYASRYGHLDIVHYLTCKQHCTVDCCDDDQQTPLHYACRYGHYDIVCYLISHHQCDPDCCNKNKQTPLHWISGADRKCTQKKALKIMKFLLSIAKCDVGKRDENYDTALHISCRSIQTDEFSKLLLKEVNIDPNAKNIAGDTPLHLACKQESAKLVQLLVRHERCNPHEKNSSGDTALHVACCLHQTDEITKFLLKEAKLDPNSINNAGDTPLHVACKNQKSTLVRLLVRDERCNPHMKNNKGDTALHVSCLLHLKERISNFLLKKAKIDPNGKNKDGDTPLHLACRRGNFTIVQLLVRDERCNPLEKNGNGDTALHVTCYYNQTDMISKFLLEESKIDPNTKNKYGDTPLHLACRMGIYVQAQVLITDKRCNLNEKNRSGDTPQLLHWACRLHLKEIVQILLRDERCNPNERDMLGDTALHVSCRLYSHKNDILQLLLEEREVDPDRKNNDGDTPLHVACRNLNTTPMKILVRSKRCNLHKKDKSGDTVLHIACRQSNRNTHDQQSGEDDRIRIKFQILLEEAKIDPSVKNSFGQTPLDLTSDPFIIRELIRHGANPQDVYKTHGKFLGKHSSKQPLKTPVKLFVVGNPSAGKSTLTKALQKEAFGFKRIKKRVVKVSSVDEKTAGIVPHDFESKIYGLVTLYDFAGQREFYGSHAALLQNAIQTSTPIFLLVVDLSDSYEEIKQSLSYWLSFLENQCASASCEPHVIVIGSHADILKSKGEDTKHKDIFITSLLTNSQFCSLQFTEFVAMDCQYADSAGMTELHHVLKSSCKSLRTQEGINFNAHCFMVYLLDKFREATALTLAAIQAQIQLDQANPLAVDVTSFVPSTIHSLCDICDQLNDRGHLLVLKNPTAIDNSWVIINQSALLADVNGTIFAPKGFKEHIKLASSTGVVPLSNMEKHFPDHDLGMLLGFLSHLEFCHEISDPEILALIDQEQTSTASKPAGVHVQEERYFFFPGLVTLEVPSTVWEPQPLFDFHCGWILQFSVLGQFFYPRFVQVLLLRLAFSFAFAQEAWCIKKDVPTLQRKCSVWKNGICWGDIYGIETLVEIAEQNRVVVLMRCPEAKSECLQLRSLLIQKVLAVAQEFCSKISAVESFINPFDTTQYPLKPTAQLTRFSIKNIASVVSKGVQSPSVLDNTGKPVLLDSLLFFEPYSDLGEPILQELFNKDSLKSSKKIPDAFISDIAERIPKKKEVIKMIFKPKATQLASRMSEASFPSSETEIIQILNIWRDQTEGTYQCLREKLDQFSVFAGRNPLETAGVSLTCMNESRLQKQDVYTASATVDHPAQAYTLLVVSPDLVDGLAALLDDLAGSWYRFAGLLGLSGGKRNQIQLDHAWKPHGSQFCLLAALQLWVNSDESATYEKITTILQKHFPDRAVPLIKAVREFAEQHSLDHLMKNLSEVAV